MTKRKMLKEEKELTKWAAPIGAGMGPTAAKAYRSQLTALVRACYEDAAKVVEENKHIKGLIVSREIASAIRGKK